MRLCAICGKQPVVGRSKIHRGMLKKKGGVGRRTVRVNLRRFLPNLQRARVLFNGTVKRIRVCTACLRNGRVQKAPLTASRRSP
jgi:large subunit ribosomal protein L28